VVKDKGIIIFIQARINSTRLKGKILQTFFGETVIDRIIRISKKISNKKKIFIVSGDKAKNYILKSYADKHGINIFFSNENNVLERFKKTIKKYNFKNKVILRITSDNYLIQPIIVKALVKNFVKKKVDYAYIKPLSHFAGEIFKGCLLFSIDSKNSKNKEHVTYEIRKKNIFKIFALSKNFYGIDHEKFFTLDTLIDLKKMQKNEYLFPSLKKLNCVNTIKKMQKKWKFV
jgi:spore coat polysaccharide biosynthesis protein SpsF